jgi:hypothetical protein
MDGWMDGWVEVKAVLRIAYSNQKLRQTDRETRITYGYTLLKIIVKNEQYLIKNSFEVFVFYKVGVNL